MFDVARKDDQGGVQKLRGEIQMGARRPETSAAASSSDMDGASCISEFIIHMNLRTSFVAYE